MEMKILKIVATLLAITLMFSMFTLAAMHGCARVDAWEERTGRYGEGLRW